MLENENKRSQALESAWLCYFNQVLGERQIISEAEKNMMRIKIEARSPRI